MPKVPISVVVITKNEQHNLDDCLETVKGWADEIIVVDDESADRTVEIARKYTSRVFQRRMDSEGSHRNRAYAEARNAWVFSLDADERLTPELKAEIDRALSGSVTDTHWTVPRKNFIGDHWMRWGGQYPAAQIKLFLKDKFRWEDTGVHPRAFAEGTCGRLSEPMIHYTYRDFGDALRKLNNQTTLEARKWFNVRASDLRKAEWKMNLGNTLWRCADRFFRTYLRKQAWRDGFIGFMLAYYAALYQLMSYAKYWELVRSNRRGNK